MLERSLVAASNLKYNHPYRSLPSIIYFHLPAWVGLVSVRFFYNYEKRFLVNFEIGFFQITNTPISSLKNISHIIKNRLIDLMIYLLTKCSVNCLSSFFLDGKIILEYIISVNRLDRGYLYLEICSASSISLSLIRCGECREVGILKPLGRLIAPLKTLESAADPSHWYTNFNIGSIKCSKTILIHRRHCHVPRCRGTRPSSLLRLFNKEHKALMLEREKWIKDTASSCMVVVTLIAAVMFAAAFTVPGGNNNNTGQPILLTEKSFMIFAISDALELFSSTTSLLIFLSILTSHYAEENFLDSLPSKLILGLATLFISIATMMTSFCATLIIVLDGKFRLHSCNSVCIVTIFVFCGFGESYLQVWHDLCWGSRAHQETQTSNNTRVLTWSDKSPTSKGSGFHYMERNGRITKETIHSDSFFLFNSSLGLSIYTLNRRWRGAWPACSFTKVAVHLCDLSVGKLCCWLASCVAVLASHGEEITPHMG
ncbi:hypothetical protein HYC85_018712 [Camellia sinensis]|uniref:PGG domain-containing protein n=1 Tax=Camellia sinensis TaxID=4442 RepID=A0A7J7GWM7_CAMSI|nr:hypothetical protein HYC85_018712 [Camellia sinensis]